MPFPPHERRSPLRRLFSAAFGVLPMLFLCLFAPPAMAQGKGEESAGGYPRPYLGSEGHSEVRKNGLRVKFFGTKSGEKYILYEPPIFLDTKTDQTTGETVLNAATTDDGIAEIRFRWDTDPKTTVAAIRRDLKTSKRYAETHDSLDITPLFVTKGRFQATRDPNVLSNSFERLSFESGAGQQSAYFDLGTQEKAQEFIDALIRTDGNRISEKLNFVYAFIGDAEDTCSATVSYRNIAETDRFKELVGEGSAERVTRKQALDLSEEVFRQMEIEASCRDGGLARRIAEQAQKLLREPENLPLENWEKLEKYTGLSADDFVAELITSLKKQDQSVERDQLRNILLDAGSSQRSVGGGYSAGVSIPGLVEAVGSLLFNISGADARQKVIAKFQDLLKKNSVSVEWDGKKLVPKSVDVFSKESIENAWKGGIEVSYTKVSERQGIHTIALTELNLSNKITVTPKAGFDIRRDMERLEQRLGDMERLEQRLVSHEKGFEWHKKWHKKQFERLEQRLEQRLVSHGRRFEWLKKQFDERLDEKLVSQERRFEWLKKQFERLDKKLVSQQGRFKWLIGYLEKKQEARFGPLAPLFFNR